MPRFSTNLIHTQVLTPYAEHLENIGAPVGKLFERAGIVADAYRSSNALITMYQAYQFAERGARHAGEETLGATVGRQVTLKDLGPLGRAIFQAPCLFDASRQFLSAMEATEPGSRCWIEQKKKEAWICYRPQERFDEGGAQAEQFDLQCLLTILRLVAGADWKPRRIRVSALREETLTSVEEFSEAEVRHHEHTTAIAFPKALFAKDMSPPPGSLPPASRNTLDGPGILAAIPILLESEAYRESPPSLETMAEQFGISGRTLQRALQEESSSYRTLVERWRFRRATHLLVEESLPLKAIAAELGYSSLNSFVRGFRAFAGITPNAYRKQRSSC